MKQNLEWFSRRSWDKSSMNFRWIWGGFSLDFLRIFHFHRISADFQWIFAGFPRISMDPRCIFYRCLPNCPWILHFSRIFIGCSLYFRFPGDVLWIFGGFSIDDPISHFRFPISHFICLCPFSIVVCPFPIAHVRPGGMRGAIEYGQRLVRAQPSQSTKQIKAEGSRYTFFRTKREDAASAGSAGPESFPLISSWTQPPFGTYIIAFSLHFAAFR